MNVLSWLFATPRRAIITLLALVALWGALDPETARLLVARLWNGFWHAFGPIILMIVQLAFAIALCVFLVKVLAKAAFGGGGGGKKK